MNTINPASAAGSGADTVHGDDGDDQIHGLHGNDVLIGGSDFWGDCTLRFAANEMNFNARASA